MILSYLPNSHYLIEIRTDNTNKETFVIKSLNSLYSANDITVIKNSYFVDANDFIYAGSIWSDATTAFKRVGFVHSFSLSCSNYNIPIDTNPLTEIDTTLGTTALD